jgi:hypothetical protein
MEERMQRATAAVLIAATALLLAQVARADPNLGYDDPYEAAYLASCGAQLPQAACRCAMEVIEDTLSFDKFAALVAHFGGDIRRVLPAERVDPAVEQSCGIAGLSTSRTTHVTQRTKISN